MWPPMNQNGQDLIHRVRIGLTGLACVFLLVLLGSVFLKLVREGEASRPPEPVTADSVKSAEAEEPKEPLAELGIAPGNAPSDGTANGSSNGH